MARIKTELPCGCVVAVDYNDMIKVSYCFQHDGKKIAAELEGIKGELFAADINEADYYEIAADKLDALIKRLGA